MIEFFGNLFLIFFIPVVIIAFFVYYAVPMRYRTVLLLILSYMFYAGMNLRYLLILFSVTLFSYVCVYMMDRYDPRRCILAGISLIALCLTGFRAWTFFGEGILAPIGLSFYSLEAISYMVDSYHGRIREKYTFVQYALYISFFPTVMSGPIERAGNLLEQIRTGTEFDYDRVSFGFKQIVYGYFCKVLVANQCGMIVDNILNGSLSEHAGFEYLVAFIFYGLQLYADFAGYSLIAIGAASAFGFSLKPNFRQPYFAESIGDFWNRWHISLSTWLRDYIYIPLGGNRKGKGRQLINLVITFLVSGLWHGAGLNFLVWGLLHAVYQIGSKLISGQTAIGKPDSRRLPIRILKMIGTFIMVDFAWIFFRVSDFNSAVGMIAQIFTDFHIIESIRSSGYMGGLSPVNFVILLVYIVIWLTVEAIHEHGICIDERLKLRSVRLCNVCYTLIWIVITIGAIRVFGADAGSFIYTRF